MSPCRYDLEFHLTLEGGFYFKKMSAYSDKLKSPAWQRKRLEVMNKAGFKCRLCGDTENALAVHHPKCIPGREPWEYDDLVCLCRKCHGKHHESDTMKKLSSYSGNLTLAQCDEVHALFVKLGGKAA